MYYGKGSSDHEDPENYVAHMEDGLEDWGNFYIQWVERFRVCFKMGFVRSNSNVEIFSLDNGIRFDNQNSSETSEYGSK